MKEENLNIEQLLERLKDNKVFKVPENYFDNFSGRLSTVIKEESKTAPRALFRINYYLKPVFSVAAVLAILFLLVYVPVKLVLQSDNNFAYNKQIEQADNTEVYTVNEHLASFEALTMLPQSQFLSTFEEVTNDGDAVTVDRDALGDYLADNSFDYEFLRNN